VYWSARKPDQCTAIAVGKLIGAVIMLLRINKKEEVKLEDGQVETLANYIKASFDAERDMKCELENRKQGWAELASLINKEQLS
jgi:hypothetical protein